MEEAVILVGTETGNAEDVAEELAVALEEGGVETEVVDMEDADPSLLDGSRAVIICTATSSGWITGRGAARSRTPS